MRWEKEDGRQKMEDKRWRWETGDEIYKTGRETGDEIHKTVDCGQDSGTGDRKPETGDGTVDRKQDGRQDSGTGDSRLCTKVGLGDGG